MEALVAELRLMTGVGTDQYEVAGEQHWSDADLEAKLQKRVSARLIQAPLEMFSMLEDTDEGTHLSFRHGEVAFEGTLDVEAATLVNFWGGAIEGEATIYPDGRVDFTDNQVGKNPLLTGIAYDLYGVAADVLTDWASAVKLGYDISTDNQTLTRSQRHKQMLEQAQEYRKRAVIGSAKMTRRDVALTGRDLPFTKAALESFEKAGLYPKSAK